MGSRVYILDFEDLDVGIQMPRLPGNHYGAESSGFVRVENRRQVGWWIVAGPGDELQRYLAHKNQHPPQDHHRALGLVLL